MYYETVFCFGSFMVIVVGVGVTRVISGGEQNIAAVMMYSSQVVTKYCFSVFLSRDLLSF